MTRIDAKETDCRNQIGVWGDGSCVELARHNHCRNCPVYERAARALLDRQAPPGYLDQVLSSDGDTEHDAQTAQEETRSVMVFRLGLEWFAFPTIDIKEVILPVQAHPVPHRNVRGFAGMVNYRGELVPCVNLRDLMGLPAVADRDRARWQRMLALEDPAGTWIVPIEEVDGIYRVEHGKFKPPPPTVELGDRRFTLSVFSLPMHYVALLDGELVRHAFRLVVGERA